MSLLAAAAIDGAKDLAVSVVKSWFSPKQKKEKDLISVGLATGYFYNFLVPLNDVLTNNTLDLFSDKEQPAGSFVLENVSVEIIIPKRLDPEARASCNTEFDKTSKGHFFMRQNKRVYGVNFQTTGADRLIIVDLARPALAAQRYYEDVLGMRTFNAPDKWLLTQIAELTAFKETLANLQKLGNGVLVNKLSFREVG